MPNHRRRHGVRNRNGRATWVVPALVAALTAMVLVWPRQQEPPPGRLLEMAPESVVGYWSTDDRRYANRFLRITVTEVELGLGEAGGAQYGVIQAVYTWTEDGFQVVRLEYSTSEGEDVLEIILHGADRMRLRNPPEVVWNRS